jgi:hypothetical protein
VWGDKRLLGDLSGNLKKIWSDLHGDMKRNKFVLVRTYSTQMKMIDNYVTMEGLFTVLLATKVRHNTETKKNEYLFVTQTDGYVPAKSPMGMFEPEIPNDIAYVIKRMKEYYEE